MASFGMVYLLIMFIFFLISVAIMRWAFGINDIVKRLDKIIELQERNRLNDHLQPKYSDVVGIGGQG